MKKNWIAVLMLAAMLLALGACSSQNADTPAGSAAEENDYVLNVAYEARYYENGAMTCVEQFDAERRLLNSEGNIPYDDHYYEEYRPTEAAAAIDISELAAMDGVQRAECTQVYHHLLNTGDALTAQPTFMAIGYDGHGAIKAIRLYYQTAEMAAPALIYQIIFELDENGNTTSAVKTASNGDVIFERYYTNTLDGDILMSSTITGTYYGGLSYQEDGTTVRETLDTPVYFESAVEYVAQQ